MYSKNITYNPSVDHIRAYASLLIIVYHSIQRIHHELQFHTTFEINKWIFTKNPLFALLVEGHTAVAWFMVLSGFIFTWGNIGSKIDYYKFIKNRFLRIFPLMITLLVVGVYTFPENYNLISLAQTVLFQANLPGSLKIASFGTMFWAISVEFAFYLLFPWLLSFFEYKDVRYAVGVIGVCILFRCIAVLNGANARDISYWTIIGRLDQFVLGMVLAYRFKQSSKSNTLAKIAGLLGSTIMVISVLFAFHMLGGWPVTASWKIFWPPIEGGVWAIFLGAYMRFADLIPDKVSRLLSSIGRISYSLYLIHFIIISTLINRGYLLNLQGISLDWNVVLNLVLLILPITFTCSILTYKVIEEPFLNMRVRYKL